MPDFAIRTTIVTKSTAAPVFMKAGRAAEKFGATTDKAMARASRSTDRFTNKFDRSVDRMQQRAMGLRGITAGFLGADVIRAGFRGAASALGSFITEAARIERATTEFGTFVKSVKLGAKIIADLRELGARTPFEFQDFQLASKVLLALRATTQKDLIPTLTMLGDTASGSADKLNRIAFAFAEVKSNSKASFQEIRQFTNAGVPLLATVADMWRRVGDTTDQAMQRARKMVKQGKLTGDVMVKAFKIMTSEGGRFFKGMDKTSKDFLGRVSTLKDEIKITKANIGEGLLPTMKKYVNMGIDVARMTSQWGLANQYLIKTEVIKWLDTGKQLLKDTWPILKGILGVVSDLMPVIRELSPLLPYLAAGWLINKTALLALAAVNAVPLIWGITKAIWAATFAQTAWNAAILLIPGGIAGAVTAVVVGLTAIAGGIFLLVRHWDTVQNALVKGFKFLISWWLRIFLFPFLQSLKGIGFIGMKIGKALGIKSIEKEFRSLMLTMDEFDAKLAKIAQDAPKPFKIAENFIQTTRTKFGGIVPVQVKPVFHEPGSVEWMRQSAFMDTKVSPTVQQKSFQQKIAGFSVNNITKMAGLPFGTRTDRDREKADTSFSIPESVVQSFSEQKKTIEHVVKLVMPGGSEDSAVTIAPGSQAPPVEIEMLGAN